MEENKILKLNDYPQTAIIIASYNAMYFLQENIDSIRKTVEPGTYHIYVIDNASTDGVAEWLLEQAEKYDDISVQCNTENVGFPRACNQGVRLAMAEGDRESDIFLLNNDTRLCANSLINLKQALYSSTDIGAVGSISNYAGNKQEVNVKFSLPSDYVEYGNKNNILATNENKNDLWEERVRLTGFAMMVKRDVWENAGGMDQAYSPGFIEDDDISMKILTQGKRLLVCHNSFIYHAGSQSFSKVDELNKLFTEHYAYFKDKFGIDSVNYVYPKEYYRDYFIENRDINLNVLIIGSGLGADLKYIRSRYKNSTVCGIEYNDKYRKYSLFTDEVYSSIEELARIPNDKKFDVVLINEHGLTGLNDKEISMFDLICSEDCNLIQEPENDAEREDVDTSEEIEETSIDEDVDNWKKTSCGIDTLAYDVLIMAVPKDYLRLERLYPKLLATMPVRRVIFVGNEEVGRLVEKSALGEKLGFINENDILPFNDVHVVMADALKERLDGMELPRGITGWYYQQFLKMSYSKICGDEYYLVWDGDTVPCAPFSMFKNGTKTPYFDLKTECHEEYFKTISKLIPGMGKVIKKSFISEHMLMKCDYMKELIATIESNDNLKGEKYYEKIIYTIHPNLLTSNSFSEFETYGTYVALKHLNSYWLRDWHSFRAGGMYFDPMKIDEIDFAWLAKDFHAISFEKGHEVRNDHKNLFDNKDFQTKLSARQMLEIAQEEYTEDSFRESWD